MKTSMSASPARSSAFVFSRTAGLGFSGTTTSRMTGSGTGVVVITLLRGGIGVEEEDVSFGFLDDFLRFDHFGRRLPESVRV